MGISRRRVLTSAVAGSAIAAAAGAELVSALSAGAASPPGDVVGKITVGYQGWFACTGDGSPINGWWHWSQNWGQPPSPSNTTIISWPDMREYTNSYPTAYANLGNGQPATLFSHYDQQTVDTHFRWMRDYGCDTAALQRFNPFGGEGPIRDAMAVKVRQRGRGVRAQVLHHVRRHQLDQHAVGDQDRLDRTRCRRYTASPAYARQNGKPVVCIWGFGFNDPGRPFAPGACLDVVNWFKAQGCYVIGGVPTYWRQGINDSRPGFSDVYHAFNMISPWMVGRTGDLAGLDWFYTQRQRRRPGRLQRQRHRLPALRDARRPLQSDTASTATSTGGTSTTWCGVGCQGIYISMFDEYNEGNQIAKTAENASPCSRPTSAGARSTRTAPPARPTTTCASPPTAARCSRASSR